MSFLFGMTSQNLGRSIGYDFTKSIKNNSGSVEIPVTRTSGATMYNQEGKRVFGPENLCTFSNTIDNASWGNKTAFLSVTGNQPDYNGLNRAWLWIPTVANQHKMLLKNETLPSKATLSYYLKPTGIVRYVQVICGAAYNNNSWVNFDLVDGIVTYEVNWKGKISAVGNGYWRIEVQVYGTAQAITHGPAIVANGLSGRTTLFTGDGTSGLLICDAQMERNSFAGVYNETGASAYYGPRLDYNPTTLQPEGLLVERIPATNLIKYSNDFSKSVWELGTGTTLTPNASIGASGNMDMTKVAMGNTASHVLQTVPVTPDGIYTASMDIKSDSGGWMYFLLFLVDAAQLRLWYNLTTNTFGTVASQTINPSTPFELLSHSVTQLQNGVLRFRITGKLNGVSQISLRTRLVDNNGSATAVIGSSYFQDSAQLESGQYQSSYIPTEATSVTRAADVMDLVVGNWLNPNEGTVLIEAKSQMPATSNIPLFSLSSGYTENRMRLVASLSDNTTGWRIAHSSVGQAQLDISAVYTPNTNLKAATIYKANRFRLALNGALAPIDDIGTVPPITTLRIANDLDFSANLWIRKFEYYRAALSDAEIIKMTT